MFLIYNDLHKEPYGFLEDVFVEEECRGEGHFQALMKKIVSLAEKQGCYKIVATSRYGRERVHQLYEKLGFQNNGKSFRLDLK